MTKQLTVLQCGSCEPLKAAVHATALGLFAVMGLYNAAAWLSRRQTHLGVNAVLYTALMLWEQRHVTHHLAELPNRRPVTPVASPGEDAPAVDPGLTSIAA